MIYDLWYGIRNLITWFPIIWKDRNWDHQYIMILLHKKLHLMEKAFASNQNHLNWERDVFKIKRCRLTLKRLIDDRVYWEDYEHHPLEPEDRIEFDMDYLFTQMRKHIRTWWD